MSKSSYFIFSVYFIFIWTALKMIVAWYHYSNPSSCKFYLSLSVHRQIYNHYSLRVCLWLILYPRIRILITGLCLDWIFYRIRNDFFINAPRFMWIEGLIITRFRVLFGCIPGCYLRIFDPFFKREVLVK